jgi:hypothetical protein
MESILAILLRPKTNTIYEYGWFNGNDWVIIEKGNRSRDYSNYAMIGSKKIDIIATKKMIESIINNKNEVNTVSNTKT